uniref:Uncharacterized protein n=1 Tax=viral metagenome TaxID=1070528 RepID=A0A6M3J296_9ZZZZ
MAEENIIQEDQIHPGQAGPDDVAAQQAVETQAKNLGWVPKDEFRGDPEQWRDADEFIQHGEATLPILRDNIKTLHKKLDDQGRVIKDFAAHHKKVEEKAYQRALKKLKEERLAAVDKGDTQEFEKIDKEIADLEKTSAGTKPGAGFAEWKEENQWYEDDIDMSIYADNVGTYLAARHPAWPSAKVFAEVTKKVKAKFPAKFKNGRRDQQPLVESGGAGPAAAAGKKYADLPAGAKKACDDFVQEGLLTREEYVKDYFAEA